MKTSYREHELDWYRLNGKHGSLRVVTDSNGDNYILSDFSWNKKNPNKTEFIEPVMEFDIETLLILERAKGEQK